jgi:hypothetical protein
MDNIWTPHQTRHRNCTFDSNRNPIPASKSQTHASPNHRTHKSLIKTDTELPCTTHVPFPTLHDTHNAHTFDPQLGLETLKYDAIPASKSHTHAPHNHRTLKTQIKTDTKPPHTLHTRFPTPHDTHNVRTLEPRLGTDRAPYWNRLGRFPCSSYNPPSTDQAHNIHRTSTDQEPTKYRPSNPST